MSDCRPAKSTAGSCTPPLASAAKHPLATSPAQVALRMAQYKRAVRRHPRAAMGALAHWLRSLDHAPSTSAGSAGQGAQHATSSPPTCVAPQLPTSTSQK